LHYSHSDRLLDDLKQLEVAGPSASLPCSAIDRQKRRRA
jgi:hypothetical protein